MQLPFNSMPDCYGGLGTERRRHLRAPSLPGAPRAGDTAGRNACAPRGTNATAELTRPSPAALPTGEAAQGAPETPLPAPLRRSSAESGRAARSGRAPRRAAEQRGAALRGSPAPRSEPAAGAAALLRAAGAVLPAVCPPLPPPPPPAGALHASAVRLAAGRQLPSLPGGQHPARRRGCRDAPPRTARPPPTPAPPSAPCRNPGPPRVTRTHRAGRAGCRGARPQGPGADCRLSPAAAAAAAPTPGPRCRCTPLPPAAPVRASRRLWRAAGWVASAPVI